MYKQGLSALSAFIHNLPVLISKKELIFSQGKCTLKPFFTLQLSVKLPELLDKEREAGVPHIATGCL